MEDYTGGNFSALGSVCTACDINFKNAVVKIGSGWLMKSSYSSLSPTAFFSSIKYH